MPSEFIPFMLMCIGALVSVGVIVVALTTVIERLSDWRESLPAVRSLEAKVDGLYFMASRDAELIGKLQVKVVELERLLSEHLKP